MAETASNRRKGITRAMKNTFSLLSRPKQQLEAGREKAMYGRQAFGSSYKQKDAVSSSPHSVKPHPPQKYSIDLTERKCELFRGVPAENALMGTKRMISRIAGPS